ncbi:MULTISPECIES: NAD(+) diphosphatase [Marinobacter]|uniref:NAD(+) diphosphatase n=1 Tax=Marinobacter TaxID=2742 RepID=UPI0020066E8C|nr:MULTISPECIES: NAD(+) diphosphatase [Marinobacter]MCK7551224.1 NAD(+) diphosphatase [Marinobacter goseongensis]MDV3505009.1 NAD(+) diphosphatase [Marinobacter sp. M-5]
MTTWIPGWSTRAPEPDSPVLAIRGSAVLRINGDWLSPWQQVRPLVSGAVEPVNLGQWGGQPCFVVEADSGFEGDQEEVPLRDAILGMPGAPTEMLSTAFQVWQWWRDHRYCGRCGGVTGLHALERARWCEPCGIPWYPRVAPCVIVMIRRDDRMLLARSSRVKRHFYSLIAGFVEPGETLEQAVVREVKEETGLDVNNIRYSTSQPWPFPHQLMMGFFADYCGGELVLQEDELAHADWFLPSDMPPVPPVTTIAGRLIRDMVEALQEPGQ